MTLTRNSLAHGRIQRPTIPVRTRALPALLLLSLGLVACEGRYTGGGFTSSVAGGTAIASYGFEMEAVDANDSGSVVDPRTGRLDPEDSFRGTFQFNDMRAGVAFHGKIDGGFSIPATSFPACMFPCDRPSRFQIPNSGVFAGTYTPVPATAGPGGYFEVLVVDKGERGKTDPADEIWVWVGSGTHAGYSNRVSPFTFRRILGGNIRYHPL